MKVTYKRAKRKPLEIVDKVRQAFEEEVQGVLDDYRSVVDNWQTDVLFTAEDISTGSNLANNVYARGMNADIFSYVDYGTQKRYAVMYPDFAPRTRPGSLASGGGGTRYPWRFDYNEDAARLRYIAARDFGHTIVEIRKDGFADKIRRALNDG